MIWCSISVCSFLKKPLDCGKNMRDGKRIFGDNKTWKGVVGMIGFSIIFTVVFGLICSKFDFLETRNYFYQYHKNTILNNLITGSALGFAYIICELPNSFIKRRLGVEPGRPAKGIAQVFSVFFDQADSLFGVIAIVAMAYPMSVGFYFCYVLLGALTHIVMNILLFFVKLRKNPF